MQLDRRSALAAALALGSCATTAGASPALETKAYGLTFLRSLDPNPDDLCAFIEANWLVMDAAAKAQGLMTEYSLERLDAADAEWNVLVRVGYPDPQGYAAIAERFEVIRRAHVTTPINGKTLAQLGRIVRSVTVRPVARG